MATFGEIAAAINLIEDKKETLRKSFDDLQSQSPSSFNFTLKWTDFDSYFTTLGSSLQHKFHLIQTLYPSSNTTSVLARPELKSFCQNSDGLGLRRFIIIAPHRPSLAAELPDAYRYAPDAAAMVLDAMEGFYRGNAPGGERTALHLVRSGCVTMLEGLMRAKPEVTVELREKAMKVAVQWKQEMLISRFKEKELNVLGFLLLVGAYGLTDGFSMDELIDCSVIVARRRQTVDLCRTMIPANKINDLIKKLINKDIQITAVKFSIEFQKTDEFPPVRLLEEYKLMSKRIAKKIRKKGKSPWACNEAAMKEANALKSMIKCIDEYHLESEYPKDTLVALVEKLKNVMGSRKRPARVPVLKYQQLSRPKKGKLNKFVQAAAPDVPTTIHTVTPLQQPCKYQQLSRPKKAKLNKFVQAAAPDVPTTIQTAAPLQQPHLQAAGLLPDHIAQYHSSAVGSTPTAPYAGSTTSPYGLTGANIGYGGNPMPPGSSVYLSEPHPPSGYYNRPASSSDGGYELPPQYHPSYYPQ